MAAAPPFPAAQLGVPSGAMDLERGAPGGDVIDFYLAGVAAGLTFCCCISYAALPHAMPQEPRKTSFLQFALGTSSLKYFRGPGDPPFTAEDFPDSGGTATYNLEGFASDLSAIWTPESKETLYDAVGRHFRPWIIYSHLVMGISKLLSFIGATYIMNLIFSYVQAPTFGAFAYKMQALSFLHAIAAAIIPAWHNEILSIRGTDPLLGGLQLLALRKMQRLRIVGVGEEQQAARAQQVMQDIGALAGALFYTPAKSILIDLALGLYSILQLRQNFGLPCVLSCAVMTVVLGMLAGKSEAAKKQREQGAWENVMRRQHVLNGLLDNFRALRLQDWVVRVGIPLAEERRAIDAQFNAAVCMGSLAGFFGGLITPVINMLCYYFLVFVRGERVSFERIVVSAAHIFQVMGSLQAVGQAMGSLAEIGFKAKQVEDFLRLPELGSEAASPPEEGPLQVVSASFAFPAASQDEDLGGKPQAVLTDINLPALAAGELVLVSGMVGCGKSSLLHALLGELPLLPSAAGRFIRPVGPVAYQPQAPMLVEGTIRENILFGIPSNDCNEEHLQRALAASQLLVDMDSSEGTLHALREHTDVGKKGAHLSGGQRARTMLARSVYAALQGVSLALLDDPMASVDNHVALTAWDSAVLQEMRSVTRVVVVNSQLLERLMPRADRLVVLDRGGRIVFQGTPSEAASPAAASALQDALGCSVTLSRQRPAHAESAVSVAEPDSASMATTTAPAPPETVAKEGVEEAPGQSNGDAKAASCSAGEEDSGSEQETDCDPATSLARFIQDCGPLAEFVRAAGGVGKVGKSSNGTWEVSPPRLSPHDWARLRRRLLRLTEAAGPEGERGEDVLQLGDLRPTRHTPTAIVWSMMCRMKGILVASSVLSMLKLYQIPMAFKAVKAWENNEYGQSDWHYLSALTFQDVGFTLLGMFIGLLDDVSKRLLCSSLARDIDDAITSLGMSFFWRSRGNAEPQIRKALNLFHEELMGIGRLPAHFLQLLLAAAALAAKAPVLWLLLGFSFVGYRKITHLADWKGSQLFPASNDVQNRFFTRVIDQFDSLLPMRALGREKHFERTLHPAMMMRPYFNYMFFQMEVLIALLQHSLGAVFNTFAIMIVVRMKAAGATSADMLAFFTLASTLGNMVKDLCGLTVPFHDLLLRYREVETLLYSNAAEPEGGDKPPSGWPRAGALSIQAVTFRYAPRAPAALRGLSLEVRASEKLGVVGRTGSGKSTLVVLLLRLGSSQGTGSSIGGRVLLDGVDVETLRLRDLRAAFAVVPQEPVVLGGISLRANVGAEHSDAEILAVLARCRLDARRLVGLPDSAPIAEALDRPLSPSSLSMGQQQLLMVARALARRPKVLLLDECTASLDRDTSDRLLEVINTHGDGATTFSIAHRLRFVVTCDRILTLSKGSMVSLETPAALLEDPDSYFASTLRLEQLEEDGQSPLPAAPSAAAAPAAAAAPPG